MKLVIILFSFFPFIAFSQSPDSILLSKHNSRQEALRNSITYIPPAVFIGYGFMSLGNNAIRKLDHSVYNDMQEDYPGFSTTIDNYLQYAPTAAVGALSLTGIKGKNSLIDQAALLAISAGIEGVTVTLSKRVSKKFRPDQSSHTSFPSGHTSTAFAAAEFLNQEYGDRSIWFGIAGYAMATTTGILRVYNNAHWFSDVIAGAGFGILSIKTTYLIYPCLKKMINTHQSHFTILPSYQKGYSGISVNGNF